MLSYNSLVFFGSPNVQRVCDSVRCQNRLLFPRPSHHCSPTIPTRPSPLVKTPGSNCGSCKKPPGRVPARPRTASSTVLAFFQNHPWLANAVTYGGLYTVAEALQQTLAKKILTDSPEDYDLVTLGRFCVQGTTAQASILYWWYRWLDARYVGTAPVIILKKLILDIFVISPPLYVSFFVGMSVMEGQEDVLRDCRLKLLDTFLASCIFWTPAMALNFLVMPPVARVTFVGFCSLIWVNFMCIMKKTGSGGDEEFERKLTQCQEIVFSKLERLDEGIKRMSLHEVQ